MIVHLTIDEIDLLWHLCGACDDMDAEGDIKSKRVAMRLERYFARIKRQVVTGKRSGA